MSEGKQIFNPDLCLCDAMGNVQTIKERVWRIDQKKSEVVDVQQMGYIGQM